MHRAQAIFLVALVPFDECPRWKRVFELLQPDVRCTSLSEAFSDEPTSQASATASVRSRLQAQLMYLR